MNRLGILVCLMASMSSANTVTAQTLHPLYKNKSDEVFEQALLGTWVSCAGAMAVCVGIQVERLPEDSYKVTLLEFEENPKVDFVFMGHVVRLGGALFGDLSLNDVIVNDKSLVKAGLDLRGIYTHVIFRLSLNGERLVTSLVDFQREEARKALTEKDIQLHLEAMEDGSVLALASTAELQEFARKMATDKRVFSDDDEWERLKKNPSGAEGRVGTKLISMLLRAAPAPLAGSRSAITADLEAGFKKRNVENRCPSTLLLGLLSTPEDLHLIPF